MSRFTFDAAASTAMLDLYVAGTYVTQYSYASGVVTLSPRSASAVTVDDYTGILTDIRYFLRQIGLQLSPPSTMRGDFTERIEKAGNDLSGLYGHGLTTVIDVTYSKVTGTLSFLARPSAAMSYVEYQKFVEWNDKFESSVYQMG